MLERVPTRSPPHIVSGSGSGVANNWFNATVTIEDDAGYQNITGASMILNSSPNYSGACSVNLYSGVYGTYGGRYYFFQYDDSGNNLGWHYYNSPPTNWISSTSTCSIQDTGATINFSGCSSGCSGSITFSVPMNFVAAGSRSMFVIASNSYGVSSPWVNQTTVNVSADPVSVTSASPNSGNGLTQTFTMVYGDTSGASSLSTAWVWFNTTSTGSAANSCQIYYDRPSGTVKLLNDAGSQWSSGAPGSGGTLANSQCSVALAGTSVSVNGTSLSFTVPVQFVTAFNGTKNIYLFAADSQYVGGWTSRGSWTIPPQVGTPSITPPGGTYTLTQRVSISTTTSGASIYYTLDGSSPATNGAAYTGPITVSHALTIQAIAKKSGWVDSQTSSAQYFFTGANGGSSGSGTGNGGGTAGQPNADSGNGTDPRRVGVRNFGAYWGAAGEQIDTTSGNLNFSLPLLKILGRGGWSIGAMLNYNSQMWRHDSAGTWLMGYDVGYGVGWQLQIGSLFPVYASSQIDHYIYTDAISPTRTTPRTTSSTGSPNPR